jgi:hypothetical protein
MLLAKQYNSAASLSVSIESLSQGGHVIPESDSGANEVSRRCVNSNAGLVAKPPGHVVGVVEGIRERRERTLNIPNRQI